MTEKRLLGQSMRGAFANGLEWLHRVDVRHSSRPVCCGTKALPPF